MRTYKLVLVVGFLLLLPPLVAAVFCVGGYVTYRRDDIEEAMEQKDIRRFETALRLTPDEVDAGRANLAVMWSHSWFMALRRAGYDMTRASIQGITPLMWTMWRDDCHAVNLILQAGADPNRMMDDGLTAMHFAASFNRWRALQILVDAGGDVNAVTAQGLTPLHMVNHAYRTVDRDPHLALMTIHTLLRLGAKVNATDAADRTPLHYAAAFPGWQLVHLLLVNGADPLVENEDGETPLDVARVEAKYIAREQVADWETQWHRRVVLILEAATRRATGKALQDTAGEARE